MRNATFCLPNQHKEHPMFAQKAVKFAVVLIPVAAMNLGFTPSQADVNNTSTKVMSENKAKVSAILDSFNTGDPKAISYLDATKYKQHNLDVAEGVDGLVEALSNAPPQGFNANVHRIFADGNYVVAHTEYDFFGPKAGFDVFLFENGKVIEHWDNLSEITPPNPSGRTQFDGATEVTDLAATEKNKAVVNGFIADVLMGGNPEKITDYISTETYLQHNSAVADGLDGLSAALAYMAENNLVMEYEKVHKVLGEGNFVLSMSEGKFGPGDHVAFYDLFRLENGLIVEHWDVIQNIPAKEDWKNDNGKF